MTSPAALEYGRFARQLIAERVAARAIVEDLRAHPHAPLAKSAITAGLVDELIEAADDLVRRAPATSAILAQRAILAASALDADYPRVLRAQSLAHAWRALANARHYASDCDSALRALDRADAAIDDEPALTHDRAVLALTRAVTLRAMNRIADALELLRSAVPVFHDLADAARVAQCELLTGMIHHGRGRTAEAKGAYRRAAKAAREAGDIKTVASATMNEGILAAEEGRVDAALSALHQARAIFQELRATGEIARASWGVGLALVTAGRFEAAIPVLREARRVFRTIGLIEEGGLAGVELAEAYLALERRAAAQRVILAVIDEFRAAKLSERALVALAYLRDLGPAARPESARHVYTYLERLRREPELLFLPPA